MLELRHLRYFLAVAEELNFSRAAERLHMAQPPLSVAIRQLEQELGTPLLTRTTRDVRLTDAGAQFLAGARETLAQLDRAVAQARRAADGELGHLRIAFSWGARFVTLPALGRAFRTSHPDVQLLTEEMWNARMPAALKSSGVDLAVSICPEIDGDLRYDRIRVEPLVALMTADHRLAGASEIELAALRDERFVMFPRDLAPRFYDTLVGVCRGAGFEPTVLNESFHTTWELGVLADVPAVALVPQSVTVDSRPNLVAVALVESPHIETVIMARGRDRSTVGSAFREVAGRVFAQERLSS
jgi:LysR family transcriptional regulator, benzoate and cis,cis-muconate-responsive activator of ben and cat genes